MSGISAAQFGNAHVHGACARWVIPAPHRVEQAVAADEFVRLGDQVCEHGSLLEPLLDVSAHRHRKAGALEEWRKVGGIRRLRGGDEVFHSLGGSLPRSAPNCQRGDYYPVCSMLIGLDKQGVGVIKSRSERPIPPGGGKT